MSEPTSPQRTVCVLGFHRSGTSLTTRILNLLGVALGDEQDLLPAAETDNPRGYWEPSWLNDANDEILAALGTHWWELFSPPDAWEQSAPLAPLRDRAQELIRDKLSGLPLRGLKDPRLSLTLPLWRPYLGEARYVVCVRNPVDAVASLQRRPEPTLSTSAWGELWLEYTARALRETRDGPRAIVFYEDYFREPRAAIEQLAAVAGVSATEGQLERAHAEVSEEVRRHMTSARELAADPAVPAATRTLFLALRAAHRLRAAAPSDGEAAELADGIERTAPDLWWLSRRAGELDPAIAHQYALADQLGQAREAHAVAHAALETVQSSRSWQMTAPLRKAADRIRDARDRG